MTSATLAPTKLIVRSWKTPVALDIFAVLGLVLAFAVPREGDATFKLAGDHDFFPLPTVVVPAHTTVVVLAILLVIGALAGHLFQFRARTGKAPLWLVIVFAVLFFVLFLAWTDAGLLPIAVPGLLVGAIGLSAPLIFGGLGGVISERSGVVNVAIEGQLLGGAFTAALVSSATHSAFVGIIAAMVGSVLVSMVLAAFAIVYRSEQVVIGVVLNMFVTGLTNFLYQTVLENHPELNDTPRLPPIEIPLLAQIPLIGPVLFRQTVIVYIMYIAVFLVWFGLFKTRWGLRTRAVGEHPAAADTVGINVGRTRFWNVSLAGAIAGLGGAYYTLDALGSFNQEMTAGAGYIALAAVIFGQWHPLKATLAGLLFGFAASLQSALSTIGSAVPSEFLLALPYVVTILAVAGLVGRSRPPAADGKPYVKS